MTGRRGGFKSNDDNCWHVRFRGRNCARRRREKKRAKNTGLHADRTINNLNYGHTTITLHALYTKYISLLNIPPIISTPLICQIIVFAPHTTNFIHC